MFFKKDRRVSLKYKLRVYFLTGLIVALPILGSFWILSILFINVTNYLYSHVAPVGLDKFWQKFIWRTIVLIILFLGVVLIGALARNYVGRRLIKLGEWIFSKIPILNRIYPTLKQVFESIWAQEKAIFKSVVLVEFPSPGMYSMGFLTGEPKGEIKEALKGENVNVFIPTVPNPTTGYYIIIPKERVIRLNISVEEAFKIIFTSGMISSPSKVIKP